MPGQTCNDQDETGQGINSGGFTYHSGDDYFLSLRLSSLRDGSAHGAASEVEDRQQDNGAKQRDEQRRQAKVALIDGADAEQWRQQQAGQQCARNPHDNIEYDPLLCLSLHDDAGEPTENPADDQPQDEVHGHISFSHIRSFKLLPSYIGSEPSRPHRNTAVAWLDVSVERHP